MPRRISPSESEVAEQRLRLRAVARCGVNRTENSRPRRSMPGSGSSTCRLLGWSAVVPGPKYPHRSLSARASSVTAGMRRSRRGRASPHTRLCGTPRRDTPNEASALRPARARLPRTDLKSDAHCAATFPEPRPDLGGRHRQLPRVLGCARVVRQRRERGLRRGWDASPNAPASRAVRYEAVRYE
jgi:hypothetical protein